MIAGGSLLRIECSSSSTSGGARSSSTLLGNLSFVNTVTGAPPTRCDVMNVVSDGTFKAGNERRAQDGLLLTYGLMTVNR